MMIVRREISGVPEGTKVYGGGVLLGTMNSDSTLKELQPLMEWLWRLIKTQASQRDLPLSG